MSVEQSVDAHLIEQTKQQIRSLVNEITQLSKSDIAPEEFHGEFDIWPPSQQNMYYTRPTAWWIDYEEICTRHGRVPADITEYVEWSQENQARNHAYAVAACKKRFPRCAGILLWGSHDTYTQPVNTSILDYYGRPKKSALALKKVWRGE